MTLNRSAAMAVLLLAGAVAGCSADRAVASAAADVSGVHVQEAVGGASLPCESASAANGTLLPPELEEGASYHDVRSVLIAGGWRADGDLDQCLTSSVGEKHLETCAKESEGMCRLCAEFQDIDACTGDGNCYMTFAKGGSELRIKTYGDVLRIREPGSEPVVKDWSVSTRSADYSSERASKAAMQVMDQHYKRVGSTALPVRSTAAVASPGSRQRTEASVARTSPLDEALRLFVSDFGSNWSAYSSLDGVTWIDPSPGKYGENRLARSGRLLLRGFGQAELPNGEEGSTYAVVEANEGESGISLDGTSSTVQRLTVWKFYFSDDYQSILSSQLEPESIVVLVAGKCSPGGDGTSDRSFFRIDLPNRASVFVEASNEEGGKYSPGYTAFDFSREAPVEKISALGCSQVRRPAGHVSRCGKSETQPGRTSSRRVTCVDDDGREKV